MNKNTATKKTLKGLNGFTLLYFIGLILISHRLIKYTQWTVSLIKKWEMPDAPFFSKILLTPAEANLGITTYLIFAIAYTVFYAFILLGLIQLQQAIKLLGEHKLFLPKISQGFKKAGRSMLIFVIGTFLVDVILLMVANTNRPMLNLVATETIVFLILAYLLLFLSSVLKEGVALQEENELTI